MVVSDVDDTAAAAAVTNLQQQGISASFCHCDVANSDQVGLDLGPRVVPFPRRTLNKLPVCVFLSRQVQQLISHTTEQLGGVDILVANAGIVKTSPFLEMSEADFDAVLAVNLKVGRGKVIKVPTLLRRLQLLPSAWSHACCTVCTDSQLQRSPARTQGCCHELNARAAAPPSVGAPCHQCSRDH